MKYLVCEIPEEVGFVRPVGDCHIGDKNSNLKKLQDDLNWVKEHPNARIFLMGDILNIAGRNTKSNPLESQKFSIRTEIDDEERESHELFKAIEIFKPYASQIIGAIDGNHSERMQNEFGISLMQVFCMQLNIPYCKYSAMVRFRVGRRTRKGARGNSFNQNYFAYFHHSTGGGGTVGGKLNRAAKLRDIVEGVDLLCTGHNHQLACAPQDVYYPSMQGGIKKRRIWYVNCGSYLEWDEGYAEKGMLAPAKLGSPRIRLNGNSEKRDIHISL